MKILEISSRVSFQNILLATDFSPASIRAFPYALAIAGRYGSKLHLAHVVPPGAHMFARPPSLDSILQEAREDAEDRMRDHLMVAKAHGFACQTLVGFGDTCDVLAGFVQRNNVDLIVLGTTGGTGFRKMVLGSVAEEIIRGSSCPVLTVGPGVSGEVTAGLQDIVCATDFSPESLSAASYALSLASEHQAHLILLHVLEYVPGHTMELMLLSAKKQLHDLLPPEAEVFCEPEVLVEFGSPADRIVEVAAERSADLIVLGVRGVGSPQGISHFFGSVAQRVVSRAPCPVLTVRGFPS